MSSWPWSRALVTGASSGIGDAFARALAAQRVDLVVVARTVDRLELLAKELETTHGVTVEVLPADLSTLDGVSSVEARLADAERPIDLLVNNAGFGTVGRFADQDADEEHRELLVNNVALLRLTHAALRPMLAADRGTILNVASIAGLAPTPFTATYGATKAFIVSLSESLSEELRKTGVTVSALCPGFTRTEFQERAQFDATSLPGFMWMSSAEVAKTGLDAAAKGEVICIPGVFNKVLMGSTQLVPRFVRRRIASAIAGRGVAH